METVNGNKNEIVKAHKALRTIVDNIIQVGEDALEFLVERGLWDEFIKWQAEKAIKKGEKTDG